MDDRTPTPLTYSQQLNNMTGAILAGGNSTRMGKDKALLSVGKTTLLAHAAGRLLPLCKDCIILSNHPTHTVPGIPRYADQVEPCGPLGGILTAFAVSNAAYLLVLAVDLPLASTALLKYLIDQVETPYSMV